MNEKFTPRESTQVTAMKGIQDTIQKNYSFTFNGTPVRIQRKLETVKLKAL